MNKYKVRFLGTSREVIIEAPTAKEAKVIFAKSENINSLGYVTASRVK